jgi:hypothetical protein
MFEAGASLASQHERINRLRPKALSAREREVKYFSGGPR